jgi:hypothetical protein
VPDTVRRGACTPAHDLPRPSHGKGGILNVVNDTGGSSTIANPDVPVTVVPFIPNPGASIGNGRVSRVSRLRRRAPADRRA